MKYPSLDTFIDPDLMTVEKDVTGFFTILPYNDLGDDLMVALLKMGANQTKLPTLIAGGILLEKDGFPVRYLPTSSIDLVKSIAMTEAKKRGHIHIAEAVCKMNDVTIWKRHSRIDAKTGIEILMDEIEEMEKLWGIADLDSVVIEKANPMTPPGFAKMQNQLKREIKTITDPMDASQWTSIIQATAGKNWLDDKRKRDAVVKAIAHAMPDRRIMRKQLDSYDRLLKARGEEINGDVRKNFEISQGVKVDPSLSLQDKKAIKALATSNGLFVRDSYGNRSDMMSRKAKAIIDKGLQDGIGRSDLASELRDKLRTSYEANQRGYLNVIASTFVGRARSRSMATAYQEASVEYAEVVAMMDDATSEICRFLDGQQIKVSETVKLMDAVDADPNHEAVKSIMPWIRESKDGLFIPGYGPLATKGSDGKLNQEIPSSKFGKNGIGFPPYHGNCRTTTVAVLKTNRIQVSRLTPTEPTTPSGASVQDRMPTPPVTIPSDVEDLVHSFATDEQLRKMIDIANSDNMQSFTGTNVSEYFAALPENIREVDRVFRTQWVIDNSGAARSAGDIILGQAPADAITALRNEIVKNLADDVADSVTDDVVEKALLHRYCATQKAIKNGNMIPQKGIEIYRGIHSEQGAAIRQAYDAGNKLTLRQYSASSYSADYNKAASYAIGGNDGAIVSERLDDSQDIFMYWKTDDAMTRSGDKEVVLINPMGGRTPTEADFLSDWSEEEIEELLGEMEY